MKRNFSSTSSRFKGRFQRF